MGHGGMKSEGNLHSTLRHETLRLIHIFKFTNVRRFLGLLIEYWLLKDGRFPL